MKDEKSFKEAVTEEVIKKGLIDNGAFPVKLGALLEKEDSVCEDYLWNSIVDTHRNYYSNVYNRSSAIKAMCVDPEHFTLNDLWRIPTKDNQGYHTLELDCYYRMIGYDMEFPVTLFGTVKVTATKIIVVQMGEKHEREDTELYISIGIPLIMYSVSDDIIDIDWQNVYDLIKE